MTHSTEQERAEFEAAWMQSTTATKPPKRYEDGDYHSPAAGEAWRWWQAARRAPVAPAQMPEPAYTVRVWGLMHDLTPTEASCGLIDGDYSLYTEQQVHQLLADQATKGKA